MRKSSKAAGTKTRRTTRRRGVGRRRRGAPLMREVASLKQTFPIAPLNRNIVYNSYQTSLAGCARAVQVARAYREYRINKVDIFFKPLLDTFAAGDAQVDAGVPYLYVLADKTASMSSVGSVGQMQEAGAIARRFDDKTLKFSFKPAVLDYVYDKNHGTNSWARPITSPWLSTNAHNDIAGTAGAWVASSVDHCGVLWIVDGGSANYQYKVEMHVHFQFRKPLQSTQTTETDRQPVEIITLVPEPVKETGPV